jgi:hypothetical protein
MIAGDPSFLPMCPRKVATGAQVMVAVLRVKALPDLFRAGDNGVNARHFLLGGVSSSPDFLHPWGVILRVKT